MKAVIMAGGKGTRLLSKTNDEIPKPMVKLNDKPILLYQIENLIKNGFHDFIFIVGHLKEKIIDYFGDGRKWNVKIEYIVENNPLGTAGSFYYLQDKIDEDFLLVFGDTIFDIDINRMYEFHKNKHADATLLVHPNNHPYDSDIVVCQNDRVVEFNYKSTKRNFYKNCVNAGFYILNKKLIEKVNQPIQCDLEKDLFVNNLNQLNIFAYHSSEYIKDVGTIERLEQASLDLKNGIVSAKNLSNKQKAIFIDRDGTLNQWKGLINHVDDIELLPNAALAVQLANSSDYLIFVITNQPVIARNLCSIEELEHMHQKIETLLGKAGAYVDGIYYCPHHPDRGYAEENKLYKIACDCRKPNIGMLQQCRDRFHIDFSKSYFVGDTTVDIKTGKNAGLKTILVQTGEAGKDEKFDVKPDAIATDLLAAIELIVK